MLTLADLYWFHFRKTPLLDDLFWGRFFNSLGRLKIDFDPHFILKSFYILLFALFSSPTLIRLNSYTSSVIAFNRLACLSCSSLSPAFPAFVIIALKSIFDWTWLFAFFVSTWLLFVVLICRSYFFTLRTISPSSDYFKDISKFFNFLSIIFFISLISLNSDSFGDISNFLKIFINNFYFLG